MIRGKYEVYSGRTHQSADRQACLPLPDGRVCRQTGRPARGQECNHQWLLEIGPSVFCQRLEYASYFPLIIFFLPKWYQYFIIFQGFSHNLTLSEIAEGRT